ncbi:hypothetical protein EB118_07150 [bacterium]|nr:hypothetical protein [bacterium]NDD82940.1 hypothetical protein [bacterium]NDG29858.1 hypothetical protein [bacterium]
MIYYRLEGTYELPTGNNTTMKIVQKTEDVDYDSSLADAMLVTRLTAKKMCNNVEPEIVFSVIPLTQAEYLTSVKVQEVLNIDEEQFLNELNNDET